MKFYFVLTIFTLQVFGICNVYGIRVSRKKCDDYQKTTLSLSTGEDDAAFKEFPFMGRVINTNGGYANGILISEKFVLSTEIDSSSTITEVVLGDLQLKTDEDNVQSRVFEVVDEIRYPLFDDPNDNIRLLKLNESIIFNEYIRPACISQPKCNFSQRLLAIGWSDTNVRSNDFLHKVKLNYISNGKCKESFKNDYKRYIRGIENKTHFCAAAAEERDMCEGFAGAALLPMSSLNEIVGIVMFKRGCGHRYPYIYVRISKFIDWIESNVWPSEYKKYKKIANALMDNCTETEDTIETDSVKITHEPMHNSTDTEDLEADRVIMRTEKVEKEPEPTATRTVKSIKSFNETFEFKTYIIFSLIIVVSMLTILLSVTFLLLLKYKSKYRQKETVCETLFNP